MVIHPLFDPPVVEETFGTDNYRRQLEELSRYCRLFIFEVGNFSDARRAVERIAVNYGQISALLLGGHGTQKSLNLGATKKDPMDQSESFRKNPDLYVSILHEESLVKWQSYLLPDAIVGLISCYTGKGRNNENNLANSLSRALIGREIYSSDQIVNTNFIKFNIYKGRLKGIIFNPQRDTTYIAKQFVTNS